MTDQVHDDDKPKCSCFETPPWMQHTEYGHTEPGSALEPNPECPVHFPEYAEHEREVDRLLAEERADTGNEYSDYHALAEEVRKLRAERPDWDRIEKAFREDIALEIEHMQQADGEVPSWNRGRQAAAEMARVGWRNWKGGLR